MSYEKLNVEPLGIDYEANEDNDDIMEYFMWGGEKHYLCDFIRTHNNPWTGKMDVPDYIHGYEADNYWNPLFVELLDDGGLNLYMAVG